MNVPLDPVLHQETRLRIVALLHRNRELGFNSMRDALGLSEGNLGTHIKRLVEAGYVRQRPALVGTRFETRYALSASGIRALLDYLQALQALLPTADELEDR